MNNIDDVTEIDITESVDQRFYLSREATYFEMFEESKENQQDYDL